MAASDDVCMKIASESAAVRCRDMLASFGPDGLYRFHEIFRRSICSTKPVTVVIAGRSESGVAHDFFTECLLKEICSSNLQELLQSMQERPSAVSSFLSVAPSMVGEGRQRHRGVLLQLIHSFQLNIGYSPSSCIANFGRLLNGVLKKDYNAAHNPDEQMHRICSTKQPVDGVIVVMSIAEAASLEQLVDTYAPFFAGEVEASQ